MTNLTSEAIVGEDAFDNERSECLTNALKLFARN